MQTLLWLQAGAEISTVRPDQYARRFLEFLTKVIN